MARPLVDCAQIDFSAGYLVGVTKRPSRWFKSRANASLGGLRILRLEEEDTEFAFGRSVWS